MSRFYDFDNFHRVKTKNMRESYIIIIPTILKKYVVKNTSLRNFKIIYDTELHQNDAKDITGMGIVN